MLGRKDTAEAVEKRMRINKYIAHAGVASRRKAEELIKEGRVTLNGKTVMELATIVKNGDIVEVDGSPIYNEEKVYYLLNKPRGVISSVSDEKNRKTVIDLMPHVKERIYPVGRLDWDTTGLLILTNDGDFTDKMIHPRNEIDKVYLARVKGIATKENLRPLTRGVVIDGKKTQPAHYNIIKVDHEKNRSVVELTIHEGRNHQVKKMFESVGLIVDKLSRTRFGTLDLTGLRPGESTKKKLVSFITLLLTRLNDEEVSDCVSKGLSEMAFSPVSTVLSFLSNLLSLYDSSNRKTWFKGSSYGNRPYLKMPSPIRDW